MWSFGLVAKWNLSVLGLLNKAQSAGGFYSECDVIRLAFTLRRVTGKALVRISLEKKINKNHLLMKMDTGATVLTAMSVRSTACMSSDA